MSAVLASVAVESDPVAIYKEFMAVYEGRKAAILDRVTPKGEAYVLQWANGLCVGADAKGMPYVTQYEHAHFFTSMAAANRHAGITNLHGESPVVISATRARYVALGKVLHAMATMNEGMAKH